MANKLYIKVVGGQVVKTVVVEDGKEPDRGDVALDNGPGGDGGPMWRPVVKVVTDTSTSTVKTVKETTRVLSPTQRTDTTTIRDMTAQEIADDDDAEKEQAVTFLDNTEPDALKAMADMIKDLRGVCYALNNEIETLKAGSPTTTAKGAFNNKVLLDGRAWNDTQFRNLLKDKL